VATFTTLKSDLLVKVGLPSTDGLLTDSALGVLVNAALRAITTQKDWPWLYTEDSFVTVAGTESYAVGTNSTKTSWLSIEDDELDLVQRTELKKWDGDTAIPVAWAESAGTIILGPTPDAVYTVKRGFYKSETVLSSGGDTPLLPDAYSDYLITFAAKLAGVRLRDTQLHSMMMAEEAAWVKRMNDNVRRSSPLLGIKTRADW